MKKIKEIISIPQLPQELVEEIIPRLPLKSIVKFRCVSKFWNTRLLCTDSSSLILKHFVLIQENNNDINLKVMVCNRLNLYSLQFETCGGGGGGGGIPKVVEMNHKFALELHCPLIMASYNGFIHISQYIWRNCYVWNPSTHECSMLPRFKVPTDWWEYMNYGFGYNEIDKELQVVGIFSTEETNSPSSVLLYSSRSRRWRKLKPIDYRVSQYGGKHVNGVLYWPAQHITTSSSRSNDNMVVAYNISGREFKEVQLPNHNLEGWSWIISGVGVLLGYLCVLLRKRSDLNHLEAWIMEDYGIENSWTRLFQISHSPREFGVQMVPLCFMNNCTEILISCQSGFLVYDFRDQSEPLKEYVMKNLPKGIYENEVVVYKDSMVKLCDLDGSGS